MVPLQLSRDDLCLIVEALNWTLNVPFDRTPQPQLSRHESLRLEEILSGLLHLLSNEFVEGLIRPDLFRVNNEVISSDNHEISLIASLLQSYFDESGPREIEIVTGLPISSFQSLLARVKDISDNPEAPLTPPSSSPPKP